MIPSLRASLWPDTLFTRMVLLIASLLLLGQVALYGFLHAYEYGPRSQRLADLWAQTLILASAVPPSAYRELQQQFDNRHIVLVTGNQPPTQGHAPENRFLRTVQTRLQQRLGATASIRIDHANHMLWLSWQGAHHVTLGLPVSQGSPVPPPYLKLIALLLLSLLGGFLAARQINRPLRTLVNTVARMRDGRLPEPVTARGPRDIRQLASRFNHLLTDIDALIRERQLVLVGVSHDLRTPLTRIRLASEFLPASEAETRDEIIANVREMDAIIEQFIGYARDGREEPLRVIALDPLIAETIERSGNPDQSQDIRFTRGLGEHAFPMQPVGMSRLIRNLIDNALNHGSPPTEVSTTPDEGHVILRIRDHGPGINTQQLGELPRAFVHGSASGGIGLGLAIVERIARDHNGRLDLDNLPGGGFEARVTLPMNRHGIHGRTID
ncbi:hypothetical protein BI364_07955 [Acidihalobacter yilgarnensis]|uniref:histidine kinase n=1 Tax=Acidihalobacter yilgarnensis TaxID=2819280 RepID=A0A1D8IN97_9GAMM|nr:ATP-binding protein [Acidihalobacter yilgarnensis]AOU97905.1 hypothetical protein BI364_07955 [Acidihalobacter yilgarnensis]